MNFKTTLFGVGIMILMSYTLSAQQTNNEVTIIGAMKNAMWKGEISGSINLDTITNKEYLYGLGPVEYLVGEILIIDGKSYKSTVLTSRTMKVEETYDIKAPFFRVHKHFKMGKAIFAR